MSLTEDDVRDAIEKELHDLGKGAWVSAEDLLGRVKVRLKEEVDPAMWRKALLSLSPSDVKRGFSMVA